MPRAFHFEPFYGIDGSILLNNRGQVAGESDMDHFFRMAEPELDRLTLEMCAYHRERGEALEPWQLKAELAAFHRTRMRAASSA